jgi:CMP-N-acetylneuraminic acid synthetase
MKTIAIIPARGGSKAIPRKNIKDLNGKPLIAHIIGTALKVKEIDKVLVSTDDQEIADISKKYGAEVPFIRPEELARDETPTLPVLQHAVKYLEEKESYKPDIVVLLYATTPLTTAEKISEAINNIIERELDSVISVVVDHGHYWTEKDGKFERFYPVIIKNRQIVKPLFKENGAIYVCNRDLLMKKNLIAGGKIGFLRMDKNESIDIDEPLDFEFVEHIITKKYKI